MTESNRGRRRVLTGTVVSDKMDKTVVVEVTHLVKHKLYKKYLNRKARYQAHDERNEYRLGDRVQIIESRPLSRNKRWRVQSLIERQEIL
ncbi:MAG: 30S ribosomal protein S17 [Deltaproteobacteria bacterium]|nr:30S ribosomal protein S17 [Deltaproteobacteria bacterium]